MLPNLEEVSTWPNSFIKIRATLTNLSFEPRISNNKRENQSKSKRKLRKLSCKHEIIKEKIGCVEQNRISSDKNYSIRYFFKITRKAMQVCHHKKGERKYETLF